MIPSTRWCFHRWATLSAILLTGWAALATAAEPTTPAAPPPRPTTPPTLEELFRTHAFSDVTLSPKGSRLATIVANKDNSRSLLFVDLETNKTEKLAADIEIDVSSYQWVDDQEVVFNVRYEKYYSQGLYSARAGNLANGKRFNAYDFTEIVGAPRRRPNRAIVWLLQSARDPNAEDRLVELNTKSNALTSDGLLPPTAWTKTYHGPKTGTPVTWFLNHDGEVAFCITYIARQDFLHRYDLATDSTHPITLDLDRYTVARVDPDGRRLWVSHFDASQGFLLQRFDPETGNFETPVMNDSSYDLGRAGLVFSEKTKQLAGIVFYQRKLTAKWLLEPFASAFALIKQKNPGAEISLSSFDETERRFIFQVTTPQDPGSFLLLDLEKKTLETVGQAAPWLANRRLQPMFPLSVTTRDGLKIEGYLTLPEGASAQNKVPLVVLPHDNPWARDTWKFDAEVQFLASKGYAVLQPNFRGSRGYAPEVSKTDRYDFKKMQEDVTDAARYVAKMEMIDGSRLAIMGTGFGGYLALAGVTAEPDLYRCAISFSGIYDWEEFVRDARWSNRSSGYERLRDFLGQPGKDSAAFVEYSPIHRVGAIKAPLLIGHSDRVDQSKVLISALKKHDIPYEEFLFDHSLHRQRYLEADYDYYRKVEVFLAQHLQSAVVPPSAK